MCNSHTPHVSTQHRQQVALVGLADKMDREVLRKGQHRLVRMDEQDDDRTERVVAHQRHTCVSDNAWQRAVEHQQCRFEVALDAINRERQSTIQTRMQT